MHPNDRKSLNFMSKAAMQSPLEEIIRHGAPSSTPAQPSPNASPETSAAEPTWLNVPASDPKEEPTAGTIRESASKNPKVTPGKVRWHDDFETARTASKVSGKPVLLFQMMGRLDDHFC